MSRQYEAQKDNFFYRSFRANLQVIFQGMQRLGKIIVGFWQLELKNLEKLQHL